MKYLILVLLLILAFAFTFFDRGFDANKMDNFVTEIVSSAQDMGSLSIYHKGEEIYQKSIGFENAVAGKKASSNTRYRIGSITNSFTAVIIMQMIEEGVLKLNTKLSEYYPQFQNADKITIEHLLRHESGLYNFSADPAYADYFEKPHSREALLNKMALSENSFKPGEQINHSDTNYVLLSLIAEKVDEKPFDQILRHRVVEPLKLKNTYVGGKIGAKPNEARSYINRAGGPPAPETDLSLMMGAGAIVATPGDINTFYYALVSGKLVNQSSFDLMQLTVGGYGLGLLGFEYEDKKMLGSFGGIDGFYSVVAHIVEDDVTICYISNASGWYSDEIVIGAINVFYGIDYDIPDFYPMLLPVALSRLVGDPLIIDRLSLLLDQGADIDGQDKEGDTALILAGWEADNIDLVRFLVERGADLNIANNNGDTPLIDAAYKSKNETLKLLLESGAKTDIKNNSGFSALDMARKNKNTEAAELIMAYSEKDKAN